MAVLHLLVFGVWLLASWAVAEAAAPTRSGQPYAEATLCATADVIFCEDFNYNNITMGPSGTSSNNLWVNPGLADGLLGFVYGTEGYRWAPASGLGSYDYNPKPLGYFHSIGGCSAPFTTAGCDHHWVANWNATDGDTGNGNVWGYLRLPGDATYPSGHAASAGKDFYIRYQVYFTSDFVFPGDPKDDRYNFSCSPALDTKIVYLFGGASSGTKDGATDCVTSPTNCSVVAGQATSTQAFDGVAARYADAIIFRYGDSSDNYKTAPLCSQCTTHPAFYDYGPYQCDANTAACWRDPDDTPVEWTSGSHKAFRMNTGKWYTFEWRYKYSSAADADDGLIEFWVDGTRVYNLTGLDTCNSADRGDCSGIGLLNIDAYHNALDCTDPWGGQMVIDNLIISTSPIGVPGAGDANSTRTPPVGQAALSGSTPSRVVGTILTPRGAVRTLLLLIILAAVGLRYRRRSRCS